MFRVYPLRFQPARLLSSRSSILRFAAISGSFTANLLDESLGILAADESIDSVTEREVGREGEIPAHSLRSVLMHLGGSAVDAD